MIYLSDLFPLDLLEEMLADGFVRRQTHPTLPLAILNYTEKAAYDGVWNEVTRQCRGLIYEDDDPASFGVGVDPVVARPFPKFFNYGEPSAPELDLDASAVVTDKLDGSLGILYPTPEGFAVATRGSFASEQARWATGWFQLHADLDFFDPTTTYLFEIIVGWNRIVVDYDWEGLVLIGTRETETGRDLDLPDDPWLLQARTPRDDAREYVRPPEEGLEDVPRLQDGDEEARYREVPRTPERLPEGMGEDEQREAEGRAPAAGARGAGVPERIQGDEAVRGLREDIPAGLHGLRPRQRDEALQRGVGDGEEHRAPAEGDREVRARLRELSPLADGCAFRIVERMTYSSLAEALAAEPRPGAEGLVVYLPDLGERVKIKQDDYVALHRILTGTNARHVWEYAAVRACRELVVAPTHWASYLGIDPERAAQLLEVGDGWLEASGVPDEFYAWVRGIIDASEEAVGSAVVAGIRTAAQAERIADRRERYEFVAFHAGPFVKEVMRLSEPNAGMAALAQMRLRAWRECCPEPSAPFARSEAVS